MTHVVANKTRECVKIVLLNPHTIFLPPSIKPHLLSMFLYFRTKMMIWKCPPFIYFFSVTIHIVGDHFGGNHRAYR